MNQEFIKLETIRDSYSQMRLTLPGQIAAMQRSLESVGQLQPVIVKREGDIYQLLDGFKRFYAFQALKKEKLHARVVEVDEITAKAMILSYNSQESSLIDYEQGQIVYSLKKDHLMNQEEIGRILHRSASWVSRRLSFIERLDETVRVQLQMGKITPTHVRALVKLPRGKQPVFLKLIIGNRLTSRQSCLLITSWLESKTGEERAWLLDHPLEVIQRASLEHEIHDSRLSIHGNRLLKTTRILGHYQHVLIGQCINPPLKELQPEELEILSSWFVHLLKKTKIIQSVLKSYDNHER